MSDLAVTRQQNLGISLNEADLPASIRERLVAVICQTPKDNLPSLLSKRFERMAKVYGRFWRSCSLSKLQEIFGRIL